MDTMIVGTFPDLSLLNSAFGHPVLVSSFTPVALEIARRIRSLEVTERIMDMSR